MKNGSNQSDAKWTESIAVNDKEFVMETKAKLGAKGPLAAESWRKMKDMSLKNPKVLTAVFLTPESAA